MRLACRRNTSPRALIAERYGILDGFQPGPPDNFISRGMAAGRVTDDTDQAVLLGEMLVERGRGHLDPERFAQALLAWEARMKAAGSLDLLGPSTPAGADAGGRRHLDRADRPRFGGPTNGAAMRVAPVGVAFAPEPLSRLVDAVFQTGHVTHNTTIAIAGASAVAAAVSAGVEGASLADALALAVEAARLGAERGFYFAGGDVAARTAWALDLVRGRSEEDALDLIYRLVGTGVATNEAVPAAIAICAVAPEDPWRVCCLAARPRRRLRYGGGYRGRHHGGLPRGRGFPRRLPSARRCWRRTRTCGWKPLSADLLCAAAGARALMGRDGGSRLVSVGSVVADIRLDVPHLPARGGDVIGSAASRHRWGRLQNILCAAARQGLPTLFAGWHGTGPYGATASGQPARARGLQPSTARWRSATAASASSWSSRTAIAQLRLPVPASSPWLGAAACPTCR